MFVCTRVSVCGCSAPDLPAAVTEGKKEGHETTFESKDVRCKRSCSGFASRPSLLSLSVSLCVLFILPMGCAQGKEEQSSGRVGPPQCLCLGWHGNPGRPRDMKEITHNRPPGLRLPASLTFPSCWFFKFPSPFLSFLPSFLSSPPFLFVLLLSLRP